MRRAVYFFLILIFLSRVGWCVDWFGPQAEVGQDGFFWYERNDESNATKVIKKEFSNNKKKEQRVVRDDRKKGDLSEEELRNFKVPWDRVWTMHPKEFQELIDTVQDIAVMDPSNKERIRELYALQAIASLRAKRFQEAVEEVRQEMPGLDMSVRRSPTLAASMLEVSKDLEQRADIIPFMRENMGIIFFMSPSCPYCEKQKPILENFIRKWGWENIRVVNIKEDSDMALRYGVQVVPDLWVVGKVGDEIKEARIKAGLSLLGEIEAGLVKAYYRWFEGKNYERPDMVEEVMTIEDIIKQLGENGGK